mmetsp:Transcript_30971/g.55448  ORF Transcript_30971/g.55448 Transcript_30971/m.55448 type:complete len:227 (+) Transcript_30971:291-971(+)
MRILLLLLQDLSLAVQGFSGNIGHLGDLSILLSRPLADDPELLLVLPPGPCHLLQQLPLPSLLAFLASLPSCRDPVLRLPRLKNALVVLKGPHLLRSPLPRFVALLELLWARPALGKPRVHLLQGRLDHEVEMTTPRLSAARRRVLPISRLSRSLACTLAWQLRTLSPVFRIQAARGRATHGAGHGLASAASPRSICRRLFGLLGILCPCSTAPWLRGAGPATLPS